jgi:hypothetical protein
MAKESTQFKKGNPGKPQGAVNKSALKVKEAYAKLLEENIEQLREDVASMKSKDRAYFLKDLSEYIMPKLARVQSDLELGEKTRETLRSWVINVKKPSGN